MIIQAVYRQRTTSVPKYCPPFTSGPPKALVLTAGYQVPFVDKIHVSATLLLQFLQISGQTTSPNGQFAGPCRNYHS